MSLLDRALGVFGLERKSSRVQSYGARYEGQSIFTEWDAERAVREGLKASTWVYTSVTKVATAMASVPILVEKKRGETWERQPTHPVQRLIDRPNEFMARQDMIERWAQHMQLAGNALWWINMVQGQPREFWPLLPDTVRPVASTRDFISAYKLRLAGEDQTLKREEVSHWQFADPSNPRWGMSPLQAAAAAVDLDTSALNWNRAVLKNDGKPPFAVMLSDNLSIPQMKEATQLIREQVTGRQTRQILVLGGATRAQPLSLNATDLDFLNGRRFTREEIAAVFMVPAVLLHSGESITYANLEAAKLILWEDRIVPLLDDFTQGLMQSLFPYWKLTSDEWRIRADLSGVRALQANLKTEAQVDLLRAQAFKVFVDSGVPANQAAKAAEVPLEDIPNGDAPRQAGAPAVRSMKRLETKDDDALEIAGRLERMDAWTERVRGNVADLLRTQGQDVAAAYAAGLDIASALSIEAWESLLSAIYTAVIEAEGKVAYSEMLKLITSRGDGGTFDVLADNVTGYIEGSVGQHIRYIDDTTKALLQDAVREGVEAGESVPTIAKRLRNLHEDWAEYRADRIARTEVAHAFGGAHDLNARQMAEEYGLTFTKVWRSAGDLRVRPDHVRLNREVVEMDDAFSNGELYAPAGVNCRCVTLYVPDG